MSIYLSGIQPTGKFHIGNYFGCIKPFITLNQEISSPRKSIFLIADMHCYTKPENISNPDQNVFDAVRSLLAAGVNPDTTHIVQQSKILEHANLAWYLSCFTRYSRAENMTQFKNNYSNHPNVGLFFYPILQSADILIYDPDYVLVGPDQHQHLELAAELSDRANNFSKQKIFKKPKIISSDIRIKNLKNGEKKMSKSEPDGCIFLLDDQNLITKKINRAATDTIFGISYEKEKRKGLANLIDIFCLIRNQDADSIVERFREMGHQNFKENISKELSEYFSDFRIKYSSLKETNIKEILQEGTKHASLIAKFKLNSFLSGVNNK